MLKQKLAPHLYVASSRFNPELLMGIDGLPRLDVVVYSHDHYDHYDHLDMETVQLLDHKVGMFLVPLGVKAHLVYWGIDPLKIKELDWWGDFEVDGLKFVATPSKHFSGRGIGGRNRLLWASWVMIGRQDRVYFWWRFRDQKAFKEIGEKYGPFDLAMLECGPYSDYWPDVHMTQEQTVLAAQDVGGGIYDADSLGQF